MELATEVTIPPGKHLLLVAPYDGGRISGTAFLAEVTLTITGSTAFIVAEERNAGNGEAYTRQADGTWLGDSGRTVVLHARV